MIRTFARGLAAAAILALSVSNANASIVIDLTDPGSSNAAGDNIASVGGSFLVQQTSGQVIDTFVRLDSNNAVSQGYNTDGRPVQFNEDPSLTVTHSLGLSSVPTATLTVNGVTEVYRHFVLQFEQPTPSGLLSLNQIQLFLSEDADKTNGTLVPATATTPPVLLFVDPFTTEVFRLNTPAPDASFLEIKLKDPNDGPGQMSLYVRDAAFQSAIEANPALDNVYLYSQFGTPPGANANSYGTQEWGVPKTSPLPVPEPSTIALALSGLGVLGLAGLRRRSVTAPDPA